MSKSFYLGLAAAIFLSGSAVGFFARRFSARETNVSLPKNYQDTRHSVSAGYPLKSYAQQGEDLIVHSILWHLGIPLEQMTYLDIGAHHPIESNNTFYFYLRGGRGVLVEPNPTYVEKLRAVRPNDKVLGVGIGIATDKANYYMIGGPGGSQLNTFDPAVAKSYAAKTGGKNFIEQVISMPLININKVIDQNFERPLSYLSIDVEGLDLSILKTLDFDRIRPAVICVETIGFGEAKSNSKIMAFMKSKNYTPRSATFVNTLFVANELLGKL